MHFSLDGKVKTEKVKTQKLKTEEVEVEVEIEKLKIEIEPPETEFWRGREKDDETGPRGEVSNQSHKVA